MNGAAATRSGMSLLGILAAGLILGGPNNRIQNRYIIEQSIPCAPTNGTFEHAGIIPESDTGELSKISGSGSYRADQAGCTLELEASF